MGEQSIGDMVSDAIAAQDSGTTPPAEPAAEPADKPTTPPPSVGTTPEPPVKAEPTAEPAPATPATPAEPAAEKPAEPAAAGDKVEPPAEPEPSFTDIPDEDLTEEQVKLKKALQADYTRKMQALAEQKKAQEAAASQTSPELQALQTQVQQMRALLQEQGLTPPEVPESGSPDGVEPQLPDFTQGLGKILEVNDLETPDDYANYVQQQVTLGLRQMHFLLTQQMQQQVQPLMGYVEQSQQSAAQQYVDSFIDSHPEMTPHLPQVYQTMQQRGLSIDDAYAAVVLPVVREQERVGAYEYGVQAGQMTAEQMAAKKQQASVPSGGAPAGAPPAAGTQEDTSIAGLWNAAKSEVSSG